MQSDWEDRKGRFPIQNLFDGMCRDTFPIVSRIEIVVFVLFLCSFWGRLIRRCIGQAKVSSKLLRVLLVRSRGSAMSCLLCSSTSSSRLFREQSVRLAQGEPSPASSSRLWRWTSSRVAKESTAAAATAVVLQKGHRSRAWLSSDDGTRCWWAENRMCHAESLWAAGVAPVQYQSSQHRSCCMV